MSEDELAAPGSAAHSAMADALSAGPRYLSRRLEPVAGEAADLPDGGGPLGAALDAFASRPYPRDFTALESFLTENADHPCAPSVRASLADEYLACGRYGDAIDAYRSAWLALSGAANREARTLAGDVLLELVRLSVVFADAGELERYVSAAEKLDLAHGESVLAEARRSLWMMRHEPGLAYRCGAAAVLSVFGQLLGGDPAVDLSAADQARASEQGMNARQVGELAGTVGLDLVAVALDDAAGALSTPSIVHWKLNHFAAVLAERDGRYLVEDAAFGPEYCVWMDRDTLLRESSGYFLIPRGDLQRQWRILGPQEAEGIWGRSTSLSTDGNGSSPFDRKTDGQGGDTDGQGDPPCPGVPVCAVHLLVVSLNIVDTPVGYSPPRGLPVQFTVTYNQRDLNQLPSADIDFAHLGPNWSYSWLSYVDDDGPGSSNPVTWIPPGGGAFVFREDIQNPGVVFESFLLGARLRRIGPGYELDLPTGEVYRFSEVVANLGNRRRILLTEILDLSRANATRLVYDQLATGARRLTKVVDANGYETTLTYPDPAAPLRIGLVTDPFGRTATLHYDNAGRLAGIVDCIDMSSTFGYRGTSTFIETMTTPYGTTAFDFGEEGRTRWLKTTHPNGEVELVEFSETPGDIQQDEAPAAVPAGMVTAPGDLAIRNTYYWDRKAMQMYPHDYSKAQVYHWLETIARTATRYLQFIGRPLENRIWFEYPAQTSPQFVNAGTLGRPTKIGRVVEDGTTSLTLIEYSPAHLPERIVDPCGRETVLVYDQAGPPQLLRVEQKTAAGSDTTLLLEYAAGFPRHASRVTDAGGGVITISYNSFAQPAKTVDALGRATELGYDPDGFLRTITRFLGGAPAVTEIAHETIGGRLSNRIQSVTGPDGQVTGFEYDELDRVTTTTYPNGSVERAEYDRLDLASYTDPMGTVTRLEHDSERRLRKITRPGEGETTIEWCACACPEQFEDARGQKTYLRYDLQGRLISRASNDHWAEEFEYERTTGHVAFHRDARGLVTAFQYYTDDRLRSIRHLTSPAGDPIPPGSVNLRYDTAYPRLVEMADESGTTTYEYGPMTPVSAGSAGRVSRVSRTSPSGRGTTIDYDYDPVGRPVGRTVTDLAGATVSQFTAEYDELGRVARKTNSLGEFTLDYLDMGMRLSSVTHDSGLRVDYRWDQPGMDATTIQWSFGPNPLLTFSYNFRQDGRPEQQTVTDPAGSFTETVEYELLTHRIKKVDVDTPARPSRSHIYDPVSNRELESVTGGPKPGNFLYSYNFVNELTSWDGVPQGAPSRDPWTYDGSGNLTRDFWRTFAWDGAGRLRAIGYLGTADESRFRYDGTGRLTEREELANGVTTQTTLVWSGGDALAELSDSGATAHFREGVVTPGALLLYLRDRLGSVRALIDTAGTVVARFDYDEWGRMVASTGASDSPGIRFAGLRQHLRSGLLLTWYRAYDPAVGRWISRDRVTGPLNPYLYADNQPLNLVDPLGLSGTPSDSGGADHNGLTGFFGQHFGYDSALAGGIRDWLNNDYFGKKPEFPWPIEFDPEDRLSQADALDALWQAAKEGLSPKILSPLVNDYYSPFDTLPFTELPITMPLAVGTLWARIIHCIISGVSTKISEVP